MKILAVLGDYYHDKDLLIKALSEAVGTSSNIDLVYASRETLIEKLKTVPDLVVLSSENRLRPNEDQSQKWMTQSEEREICTYVKGGGNWFAWHSGLAGYEENMEYVGMLGGHFTHHPEDHVTVRYFYKEEHELGKGKGPVEIKDEHYFIERIEASSYFLQSESVYGTSDAGWTRSYGAGKVCCYIPSHNEGGLLSEAVQRDLREIVAWFSG